MRLHFVLLLFILCFIVFSCGRSGNDDSIPVQELSHGDKMKLKQYISQGRILYKTNCSNCHQANGEGLASLYPPLKNSDFLMKDVTGAICYVKNGLQGEIKVNGIVFNQSMPANNQLTDLELAEIVTFVVNELNDSTVLISQKLVRQVLKECQE